MSAAQSIAGLPSNQGSITSKPHHLTTPLDAVAQECQQPNRRLEQIFEQHKAPIAEPNGFRR